MRTIGSKSVDRHGEPVVSLDRGPTEQHVRGPEAGAHPRGARLIVDGFHTGKENMRRDGLLLEAAQPAIRIYGWRPACVSLGRTQTVADIDQQAALAHGVDVVSRVTGGGAILHNEMEVTYAVVLPMDYPGLPVSIRESYRFISRPVLEAFRSLGAPVEFGEGTGGRETLCYLREEGISIFADGRKISGGAQRRTQKAVLQHGTMVLELDAERTAEILGARMEAVHAKVTGLDVLGIRVDREEVVRALVEAYKAWIPVDEEHDGWDGRTWDR